MFLAAFSSQTIGSILEAAITRDPATAETGQRLVAALDEVVMLGVPGLRFIQAPEDACRSRMYDNPAAYAAITRQRDFALDSGDRSLRELP